MAGKEVGDGIKYITKQAGASDTVADVTAAGVGGAAAYGQPIRRITSTTAAMSGVQPSLLAMFGFVLHLVAWLLVETGVIELSANLAPLYLRLTMTPSCVSWDSSSDSGPKKLEKSK